MAVAEARFRVMGSEAHLLITGARRSLVRRTQELLEHLERRWSRFLPESDVSRANAAPGHTVKVHGDTIRLMETARQGWIITGGRFDPTVLPAVTALGYRQSLDSGEFAFEVSSPMPAAGFDSIRTDDSRRTIRFERGVGFDPGAIGKGLAADMAIELLLAHGADGALVSIGGDLRVAGVGPDGGDWSVAVEDPRDRGDLVALLRLADGGVATSTARHGRWTVDDLPVCHVVEPSSGAVVQTDVASATVVAAEAWTAEVVATGALVAGVDAGLRLIDDLGLHGLIVDEAGIVHPSSRLGALA